MTSFSGCINKELSTLLGNAFTRELRTRRKVRGVPRERLSLGDELSRGSLLHGFPRSSPKGETGKGKEEEAHLSESSHQAGLAHAGVPHEHDLEEKLVVLHVREPPGGEVPRGVRARKSPVQQGRCIRAVRGEHQPTPTAAPSTFRKRSPRTTAECHTRTHTDGRTAVCTRFPGLVRGREREREGT